MTRRRGAVTRETVVETCGESNGPAIGCLHLSTCIAPRQCDVLPTVRPRVVRRRSTFDCNERTDGRTDDRRVKRFRYLRTALRQYSRDGATDTTTTTNAIDKRDNIAIDRLICDISIFVDILYTTACERRPTATLLALLIFLQN